tara:strand:- start:441 stop:704 length:264 start_codon:yes stop_codon:yes gene_type:complete
VHSAALLWSRSGGDEWLFCRAAARALCVNEAAAIALLREHIAANERADCPHCGGVGSVAVALVQCRSADEGESARHACSICRKRWTA